MPSNREKVCCHNIPRCRQRFVDAVTKYSQEEPYQCICAHEGFRVNCLRWDVLDIAWMAYKQHYGADGYDDPNVNKRYRHIAYRQLARLLFGVVGRSNRYILPSCAVTIIRNTFPIQQEEQYTGFMFAE